MEQTNNHSTSFMSDDIRELAKSFSLAKKKFKATGLDGNNAHLRTKYPKLGGIFHAVEDALDEHDITLLQFKRAHDTGIEYMHTQIFHRTTGQFIEDLRIVESEKPGNQGKGAADTYVKKAAILTICGIVASEETDDDGQDEDNYIKARSQESIISSDQLKFLQDEIKKRKNAILIHNNILKFNKIQDLSQLKVSSFESVKSYIINNGE